MGASGGTVIAAAALAWMAGVALQLQQPALWDRGAYGALAASALLLGGSVAVAGRRGRRRGGAAALLLLACLCVACAALAFATTGWRAQSRLAQVLSPGLEGRDLVLTGRVLQMPQIDEDGLRFVLEVDSAHAVGPQAATVTAPPRVWLGWSRGWQEGALVAGAPVPLQAGERWQLPVQLKRPHGVLNPGGFDSELWLFEQGIGAVGQVRATAPSEPQRLSGPPWWALLAQIEALRQRLRDAILLRPGGDARTTGVLAALAVGDQSAVDSAGWDLFRSTSTAHLVVVSGLHITLFAWLAAALLGAAWRRSERLMHWLPTPIAQRWGGLVLATLYALLAGWGVPAQRTALMLGGTVLLRGAGLNWPASLICVVAGAVVIAVDPWALLQPGFWLSFVAVLMLIASEPAGRAAAQAQAAHEPAPSRGRRLRKALQAGLHSQWVAALGLAPLSLLFFQQLSLVGLLANLVAVPAITLLVTPLALLGLWWAPLWSVAAAAVQPLLAWLAWLASWPLAVWTVPEASAWAAVAALLGGGLLVLPLPWRLRCLGLPLLLPLLWPAVPRPVPGRFELVAADVGQGSAVLVRTRNHLLLHDTGPKFSRDSDAGRQVLLPLLQARGERRIDELLLSHRDLDHVGGAAALLDKLPVAQLRSSIEAGHPLRERPLPQTACHAGQAWTWDGVRFEVLHPPAGPYPADARPNTLSCVLRVEDAQGRSALLTGDIEAPQEQEMVARLGARLRSEVLLVPHHGSRTSSSAAFLAAVQPRVAVMQLGYRNRFGHPHASVLAGYAGAGVPVVRTDNCGAWVWAAEGAWCTRDVRRRYWHWREAVPPPAGGAVVASVEDAGERE